MSAFIQIAPKATNPLPDLGACCNHRRFLWFILASARPYRPTGLNKNAVPHLYPLSAVQAGQLGEVRVILALVPSHQRLKLACRRGEARFLSCHSPKSIPKRRALREKRPVVFFAETIMVKSVLAVFWRHERLTSNVWLHDGQWVAPPLSAFGGASGKRQREPMRDINPGTKIAAKSRGGSVKRPPGSAVKPQGCEASHAYALFQDILLVR